MGLWAGVFVIFRLHDEELEMDSPCYTLRESPVLSVNL